MNQANEIHQVWLENLIKEIRMYSGITKPFTMDSTLIEDLHIDSLELLELVTAIEQYSEQPLNDEIWMEWYRLQDIIDYLYLVCLTDNA